MSDNITLPRELVFRAVKALTPMAYDTWPRERNEVVEALRAALAAPRPEPEPVRCNPADYCAARHMNLYAAPPALAAPRPEPSGYAYRYADNVLRFNDGGWLSGWPPVEAVPYWFAPPAAAPEPEKRHPGYVIGNHWLETAYERLCAGEAEDAILEDYDLVREPRVRDLRRDAESWRRLLEGASIAADADTSTASAAVDASKAPEDKA